jgi:hypothetical protein
MGPKSYLCECNPHWKNAFKVSKNDKTFIIGAMEQPKNFGKCVIF